MAIIHNQELWDDAKKEILEKIPDELVEKIAKLIHEVYS